MSVSNKSFFSGGYAEKNNEVQPTDNLYYEGQNVNDCMIREEQEEVKKESKKKHFLANYNMFF